LSYRSLTACVGDNQPIRWKRRNSLGRGTFGEVILGMNLGTRKLMAVKEVNFGNVPDINKKVSLILIAFTPRA
jgi:serine/threonine protein kinase